MAKLIVSIACNKALSPESCPASVKEDAEAKCNELYSNVFNACNELVDPAPYIDKCIADYCLCHTDNRDDCYCKSLAVYASVCAANRVVILYTGEKRFVYSMFLKLQNCMITNVCRKLGTYCPPEMIYQQCMWSLVSQNLQLLW